MLNGKEASDSLNKRKALHFSNLSIPKVVDISNPPKDTFFSSQVEAIMFAFGECRYMNSDILELVEETVRQFILFVIRRLWKQRRVEEGPPGNQLKLSDVIHLVQKDHRLTRRTCAFVKSVGGSVDDVFNSKEYTVDNYSVIRSLSVPFSETTQKMENTGVVETSPHIPAKETDSVSSPKNTSSFHNRLSSSETTTRQQKESTEYSSIFNNIDIMSILVSKAAASLSQVFSQSMYHEYSYCRKVSFTVNLSQQRNSVVDRSVYFLQWLGIAQSEIQLENAAVHALGYLCWETIGLITQTSLMIRHMSENVLSPKTSGVGNKHIGSVDPRRLYCCTAQQFILALRHGLGTWLVLPLHDEELGSIAKELERKSILGDRSMFDVSGLHLRKVSQLQVYHILDTLRFLRDIRRNGTCTNILVNLFGDYLLGR